MWGRHAGVLIALTYLVLSYGVATATVGVLHRRSVATRTHPLLLPAPKYLVLMVLDGARPDYFDLTSLPHVDALRAHGIQYTDAFDGILETETPAGHTTISTGSTPRRNGILGFDWAQNDNDYSLFSPDVVRAGAIERIMQAAHVPTIASLYKARYPGARVVALSGHKYYAADPLGGPAADAIMYYQGSASGKYVPVSIPGHSPPAGILDNPSLIGPSTHLPDGGEDSLVTRLALATFRRLHQRLTLINFPEFDWPLGHVYGGIGAPNKVITLMKNFDHDLGMIEAAYRRAGVLNKTLFVITADHGMDSVTRFIPDTILTGAVAAAGTHAPAMSNSTGAYIWLADASKAREVARNIVRAADPGIQSVYYLTTRGGRMTYLPEMSPGRADQFADQYLLNTLLNGHEPAVVAFARRGQSFSSPATNWKADHGGADWGSQHIPLIMAGPGVRGGTITDAPAQLDDLAPTVLADMGVRPTGMEGHILSEALLAPSRKAETDRSAEIRLVRPVTDALIAARGSG